MALTVFESNSPNLHMFLELHARCPRIMDIMRWSNRIGFSWADEILARSTLAAPAAHSGEMIDAVGLISTSTRATFIEFSESGREPYCLVASRIGIGYQIAAIYFHESEFLFQWEDQTYGLGKAAIENYRRLKHHRAKHQIELKPLEDGISLFIGHENFAHHMMNELTGLWRIKEAGLFSRVRSIFTQYEAMGPITELFPELDGVPKHAVLVSENFEVLASNNILLIGGIRIQAALRDRMRAHITTLATRLYPETVESTLASSGPRVLLAVRTHSRVVDNNTGMILAICHRLREQFGLVKPVLDGFSLPHDIDVNKNYLPWFREKAALSSRQVDAVAEHFVAAGFTDVTDTANKDVVLALWISMQADYYFSNQGTQQHKAGWLSDARGVVHFPPDKVDQPLSTGWFQGLVEGSPKFSILPKKFVKSFTDGNDKAAAGYMFDNIEAAADWAVASLLDHRGESPPAADAETPHVTNASS